MKMTNNTLTAVPGLHVGHATHIEGATGCTVVLCPPNTVAGVDQRGGAPGTRETDLLRPMHAVQHIHGLMLSGGSAYGLATADGVMRYLEEQGIGFPIGDFVTPIVPAAILFDLLMGTPGIRPDADMGYQACEAATTDPVEQGSVGAGTGCTIGKMMGQPSQMTKGGLGSASVDLGDGLYVAAMIAVNALGDVINEDGTVLAGLRSPEGGFGDSMQIMQMMARMTETPGDGNTVIGVVATNARLSKEETNKVAQMAHDGLARAIRPAHLMLDGDTIFSLATGEIAANVNAIGAYAAEMTAAAIRNGIRAATSLGGVRALNESR